MPGQKAFFQRTFELQDPRHARLLPMEGLRGAAVTLVFLQHYCVQSQILGQVPGITAIATKLFRDYGNLGVELFFVLSGFLIYGTLIRKAPPFISFMLRRYQRIYPAFLVVFAAALAMTIVLRIPDKIPDGGLAATLYLIGNLTLVAGLVPMTRIVEVAWSLSYELFFYIVTAAAVLGLGMHRLSAKHRIGILTALTIMFVLLSYADIPHFPIRMMPFLAGMLLAEGVGNRVPTWTGWAFPAIAFALSAMQLISGPTTELVHTVAFFVLCAVCFRGAGSVSRAMTWTPLRWLGNMSYSYYLLHGFVVRVAMLALGRLLPDGLPDVVFWGFMPVVYVATLIASAILFIAIEKPLSLRPATPKLEQASAEGVATRELQRP